MMFTILRDIFYFYSVLLIQLFCDLVFGNVDTLGITYIIPKIEVEIIF